MAKEFRSATGVVPNLENWPGCDNASDRQRLHDAPPGHFSSGKTRLERCNGAFHRLSDSGILISGFADFCVAARRHKI
jgi:hypothetical protein